MIGNRIYWISSHGTNSEGEVQERRHRLFATEIVGTTPPTVMAVDKPYTTLVKDLNSKFPELNLEAASKNSSEIAQRPQHRRVGRGQWHAPDRISQPSF